MDNKNMLKVEELEQVTGGVTTDDVECKPIIRITTIECENSESIDWEQEIE